jgi:hypothetical protein
MTNVSRYTNVKTFDNKLDKIKQHYIDDSIKLTPTEEDLRIRLDTAFSFLCKFKSNEQAKLLLVEKFNYSPAQAYRDLRSAIELFGDVVKSKKEAHRYILYEMGINNYQLAEKKHDADQMNRALANLIKITGVDREDYDLPDPSKIQPPVQILSLTFNFIRSPYFKQIDKKAQAQLLDLQAKIQVVIDKSPVKEYLDLLEVQDAEIVTDEDK